MAATKSKTAITQLTTAASGNAQSTTIDISTYYRASIYIDHVNGTTITTGASMQVQVRPETGSQWYDLGGPLIGNLTNSAVQTWVVELPDDAGDVRIDYTASDYTGGTETLDAEVGYISAV